jgi:hypothetical protein
MGDDPVLYRTFILLGRLDRSRPSRPDRLIDSRPVDQDESRDPFEYRSSPLRDPIDVCIGNVPPRGSTVAVRLLSLRSPGHVCVRNSIILSQNISPDVGSYFDYRVIQPPSYALVSMLLIKNSGL